MTDTMAVELPSHAAVLLPVDAENQARADFYALFAALMLAPPDQLLLDRIASADSVISQGDANLLDRSWERLTMAAAAVDAQAVAEEYAQLFVEAGTPQVNPYGSLYLTGFMMEKPLAALREDLAGMGFARRAGSGELEDHLGALCETMRLMITGEATGKRQSIARQKVFFERHIGPWWQRCLDDIRKARGVNFYACVADCVEAFLEIEREAFDLEDSDPACADRGR